MFVYLFKYCLAKLTDWERNGNFSEDTMTQCSSMRWL